MASRWWAVGSLSLVGLLWAPRGALAQPGEDPTTHEEDTSGVEPGATSPPPLVATRVGPPPAGGTAAQRQLWLGARLAELLTSHPLLAPAKIGIVVVDMASGKTLYGHEDKTPLNAASNVKLVTTSAAMSLLGPDFRWKTGLFGDPAWHGGETLPGDLYLRGVGDPSLATSDLLSLASELASLGLKKIQGGIVIDDSYFDAERLAPSFAQKTEDAYFRAPAGAVSLNSNAFDVVVTPGGADGSKARVTCDPMSPYFEIKGSVTTTSRGRTNIAVSARPKPGKDPGMIVSVSGTIRTGELEWGTRKRVEHPELYAGFTLQAALARYGITVGKKVPRRAVVKPKSRPLGAHFSPALAVLIRDVNKHSNNFMAEQLVKTIGAEATGLPGSWDSGMAAIKGFLSDLGIAKDSYTLTNGSGLYDSNKLTADLLARVLRASYRDFRYASEYVASLPIAGIDGTLGKRMDGTGAERFVRAKTGTLSGVSALSGYVGGTGGRVPLVFSVVENGIPQSGGAKHDAHVLQDEIAVALVAYIESEKP